MAENKGTGGANGDGSGGATDLETDETEPSGDGGGKSVSRSTYMKTVTEAKNARERARIAEEKAAKLEQEKLAAQGDKDGEIKNLQAQLDKERKDRKGLQQTVVKKALTAQITAVATKAGCIDPDAVMRLIDLGELGEVDGDTLEADPEAVDQVISDLKKSKPYLFSKAGPKINGKNPTGKVDDVVEEKEDLSKLTSAELRDRLRKLDHKPNVIK